jgi:hypothetical protein
MRWVIAAMFLGACSHPAPKRAAEPQIAVTGTASLLGTWVTTDDLDWSYRLVVVADGRFSMRVDRGKLGPCEQRGWISGTGPFTLTLTKDGCSDSHAVGGALNVEVPSLTANAMTLQYAVGAQTVTRAYTRVPN